MSEVMKIEKLGHYFVIQQKGMAKDNSIEFIVSKDKETPNLQSSMKAILHPIFHQESISNGLSSFFPKQQYIHEFFFLNRNEGMYLAIIIDSQIQKLNLNINDILLRPTSCLKIVLDSLLLIEELHSVGFTMKQSFMNYLQIAKGTKNVSVLRCINRALNSYMQEEYEGNLSAEERKNLNQTEKSYLVKFIKDLIGMLQENKQQTPNVIQFLLDQLIENSLNLMKLTRNFTSYYFKLYLYDLTLRFDPSTLNLVIYITDLKKKKKTTTEIHKRGFLRLQQSNLAISVQQLFNSLLAYPKHIKIQQKNQLYFFCQKNKKVSKICLFSDELPKQIDIKSTTKIIEQSGPFLQYQKNQSQRSDYPYNCIISIVAHFYDQSQNKKFTKRGVGFLVTPNFVITAAHVLTQKNEPSKKTQIYYQGRKAQGKKIEIPEDFYQTRYRQQNDYALILLQEKLTFCRLFGIAKEYTAKSAIGLVKIKDAKNGTIFSLDASQLADYSKSKHLISHQIHTNQGDSGSPIIVKLSILNDQEYHRQYIRKETKKKQKQIEDVEDYYVIAIHTLQKVEEGKRQSLRFTNQIVENIVKMAKEMKQNQQTQIIRRCVNFEEEVSRIKRIFQNLKSIEKDLNKWTEKKLRSDAVILKLNQFQTISRGELEKQYFKLIQNFFTYIVESYAINFYRKEKSIKISNDMKSFKYRYQNLPPEEVSLFIENINAFLQFFKSDKPIRGICYSLLKILYKQLKQIITLLKFPWEYLGTFFKFIEYKEYYLSEFITFFRELTDLVEARSKLDLFLQMTNVQTSIQSRKKILSWSVKDKYYLDYQKVESQFNYSFEGPSIAIPFMQFSFKKQYRYKMQDYLSFQYQVEFDSENTAEEYVFQLMKFVTKDFLFVYPTIERDQRPKQLVSIKFNLNFTPISIEDYLRQLNFKQLLKTFSLILNNVKMLHQLEFFLCSPLEFCTLADFRSKRIFFCYMGHPEALCKKITSQLSEMSEKQKNQLIEYYPVKQILEKNTQKEHYKKIDVWMVGKSLIRLLKLTDNREELSNKQFLQTILQTTQASPDQRISILELVETVQSFMST